MNLQETEGQAYRPTSQTIALPSLLVQRLLALAIVSWTAYCVFDYPFAQVWLGLILCTYGILLLFQPQAWLLVIPILLPLLNLAPWSGRFFLEDFDFIIWVTLASSLWQGDYSTSVRPRFAKTPWIFIALFLATHSIAMLRGLWPLAAMDGNAFSSYYSQYNALRVGKSLIWAVLLIPALLRAFAFDREKSRQFLILGVNIGLIGMGIAVLWERGVLSDLLYGNGIYAKLQSLTDFSTDYRITALFSEMHTGGEAVDGYIALTWPFALAGLITARSKWPMGIGIVALSAGLYSALVTFSRGTYIALGVSLLTFAFFFLKNHSHTHLSGKVKWSFPLILLALAGICIVLYAKGGYYTLIAALGIFFGAIILSFLKQLRGDLRSILLAIMFIAGFALIMRGLLTSKWVSNGLVESLMLSLPFSSCLLVLGIFVGVQVRNNLSLHELGISLAFLATLIAVCIPVLSGSYMQSRFTTVHEDFSGRFDHWKHATALMDSNLSTFAFGMGLGVFPRSYLWGEEKEKSSIAALHEDEVNTYLRLSNTMDLALGQRVNLEANQPYKLTLDVRTKSEIGSLTISLCRRNIIAPWDSDCVSTSLNAKAGQWQHLNWEFNIGQTGDGVRLLRHPLVLRLTHFFYNQLGGVNLPLNFIDIDNVKLLDQFGENRIINGNFEDGMDNWFPTSDHAHLPLHIKNLFVNIYFEQGLLGIMAFFALCLYSLNSAIHQSQQGDIFVLTLLSSMMGFFSVGLIGTLYDVPRVIFLFFLLMLTSLVQEARQLRVSPAKHNQETTRHKHTPAKRGSFLKPTLK